MYDNIGGKIKGLAKATFIVEAIAAVITGIALMAFGVYSCLHTEKDYATIGASMFEDDSEEEKEFSYIGE